jgi:Domain of unknown function (DUF1972)
MCQTDPASINEANALYCKVTKKRMKIAILGTRGIPARYGGFETLADQLSKRLVDRGHEVSVYCRRAFARPDDVFDARVRRVILRAQ